MQVKEQGYGTQIHLITMSYFVRFDEHINAVLSNPNIKSPICGAAVTPTRLGRRRWTSYKTTIPDSLNINSFLLAERRVYFLRLCRTHRI